MRYFYNTGDEKRYSVAELVQVFCDLMKEDESYKEISFYDFLNEASGKNGVLIEIKKPLSEKEVTAVKLAAIEFNNAMKSLYEALDNVSEESFNEFLSDGYPFQNSFTDAKYDVDWWCENVCRFADRLSRKN